jgi:hypothetical protein
MTLFEKITNSFSSDIFSCSNFSMEDESKAYDGCTFYLNDSKIHYRKAKSTPKKEGQFVTFWKRIPTGVIAPFEQVDDFNFLIVAIESELDSGYFLFPKEVLATKNIVLTAVNEGKRAFRIYPPWNIPKNKQAITSQKWQLQYFLNKNASDCFLLEEMLLKPTKTS